MGTAWIGYSDKRFENTFQWRPTGTMDILMKYRNFIKGEPNNSGDEDCVSMNGDVGQWKDEKCEVEKPFVCEYGMSLFAFNLFVFYLDEVV